MNNEDRRTLDVSGGTGMPLETLNWHGTALEREPPSSIEFRKPGDWVMRITADRRIEVNEGITVTEAAQAVLEALQKLMKQPEQEPVALIRDGVLRWHIPHEHYSRPTWTAHGTHMLYAQPQPPRKPLTDEDIEQAQRTVWRSLPSDFDYTTSSWIEIGIRYAEAAHGIKGEV